MTRPFFFCLFFGLFLLSLIGGVKPNTNAPKTFESGLVTTEYVDSKVLFITSSDGKIYAYDMEKHNLKWMIETSMTLQQWSYNSDYKLDNMDFMLMPSYNGKMQIFSPSEGFQEFEKAELEQALHKCFSPGRIKYFSKVQETFLLLDLNKGVFWSLEDGYENIDTSRLDTFGVLKIRQYRYNAIDFQNMKEMWSLKTSDLDFFTYFQFLNHGNIPNPSKLLQDFKIICKGGNTIEVLRARDEAFLRSIETENEVISVHSLDPNSGFFSLKIESIGAMAAPESEINQLMVYDQVHSRPAGRGDDSHELAVFVERTQKESSWVSSYSGAGDIQIKRDYMYSSESIFGCLREEINKKHAIQLANSSLLENGTINLVVYDDKIEEKLTVYTNPYVLVGTLGCMGLTGILSLVIERRRNKKQKKPTTSIGTETMVDSAIEDNGSTGGSSSSKIKAKANGADDGSRERKKKPKKREFEVFTKEILGLGSHGTIVFQGEFQGKSIAVKRFLKCYLEMARMEIDLLMATEHPNIIRYYLYEEDNEFIYLILERCLCSMRNFIDQFKKGDSKPKESKGFDFGSDLKDTVNYRQAIRKIYREKTITPETVRKFAFEIAKGLQYLHRIGIIHRDIKPENILLSMNLDAKLADFGISRVLKPEEENFLTEAGSTGWKAPEMLRKTDVKSKAVDIFSLGCTFYYIATNGEHPFGERHEREANILANRPRLNYLEDLALEHLIRCMIKFNPDERYTIDDVLNHPYFWDDGKKLAFIQEVSDFVESTDPRLGRMLEEYCQNKGAIPTPWNKALDQALIQDLTSFRFYDFKSVKELLRVIRNKKNHYYELSEEVKEALGKMPTGVWNYFNERFPRLFMHVYIFCKEQKVELSHLI